MLKLQFADNRQSSFWIVDSQFGIGSAPKNQIVIKDEVILPFHAVIEQQGGHLMIRPAEPGALITINGEAVTDKAELKVNDRIALAGVELILVDPARNVARPMSPASPMAPRPAPARAEASQKWQITALTGPLANTRILIDGVKLVGRDPTADIQISGGHISRKHAEFLLREGQLWIRDLNSSNGTPRYTTFVFRSGMSRAPVTKSAVLCETASAMSVNGSSVRSATFWNHGVEDRLACSCTMVGMPRMAPTTRPKVVAP